MSHHPIEVRNLSYRYHVGTQSLDGISFLSRQGGAVWMVGANDAGKFSLMML